MKKSLLILAVGAALAAFGADVDKDKAAREAAAKKAKIEQRQKAKAAAAKREAERKAKQKADEKERLEKQLQRDADEAKKKGITVEELYRERAEKESANVGMSVDAWMKLSGREKADARDAKKYGVPATEWIALSDEDRKAKIEEIQKRKKEEADRKTAERLGISYEEFQKREAEKLAEKQKAEKKALLAKKKAEAAKKAAQRKAKLKTEAQMKAAKEKKEKEKKK